MIATDKASRLTHWLQVVCTRPRTAVLFLVLLHGMLIHRLLVPPFYMINMVDSVGYINSGRTLISGLAERSPHLPSFAANPLVAFFYALIYIPFHKSLHWVIFSEWTGRALMFIGIWVTIYLVAREWRPRVPVFLALGLLVASPVFQPLLYEGPYGLFAIVSGLAFWQVLGFNRTGRLRHAALAGVLVGASPLIRGDGLTLMPLFLLCCAAIVARRNERSKPLAAVARTVLIGALPFLVITGGYLFLDDYFQGRPLLLASARSYSVFELAEGYVYSNDASAYELGITRARELYGTPEENNYSILSAIARNPTAALSRMLVVAASFPLVLLKTFGGVLGLLVVGLAAVGVIDMWQHRERFVLALCALWLAYLGIYLVFYFQTYYLAMSYYIVLPMAAVGLQRVAQGVGRRIRGFSGSSPDTQLAGLALGGFFAAVITASMAFNATQLPQLPDYESSGEAKSAEYLRDTLPRGARVAAFAPAVVWMAKMHYVPMFLDIASFAEYSPFSLSTHEHLQRWLDETDTNAIYTDYLLEWFSPEEYALFDRAVQDGLLREGFRYVDPDPHKTHILGALGLDLRPLHRVLIRD